MPRPIRLCGSEGEVIKGIYLHGVQSRLGYYSSCERRSFSEDGDVKLISYGVGSTGGPFSAQLTNCTSFAGRVVWNVCE